MLFGLNDVSILDSFDILYLPVNIVNICDQLYVLRLYRALTVNCGIPGRNLIPPLILSDNIYMNVHVVIVYCGGSDVCWVFALNSVGVGQPFLKSFNHSLTIQRTIWIRYHIEKSWMWMQAEFVTVGKPRIDGFRCFEERLTSRFEKLRTGCNCLKIG